MNGQWRSAAIAPLLPTIEHSLKLRFKDRRHQWGQNNVEPVASYRMKRERHPKLLIIGAMGPEIGVHTRERRPAERLSFCWWGNRAGSDGLHK